MSQYQILLEVHRDDMMSTLDVEPADSTLEIRVDGDTLKGAFRHLIDRMPTADREALRSAIDDLQPQ